jgi:hypothetical protein
MLTDISNNRIFGKPVWCFRQKETQQRLVHYSSSLLRQNLHGLHHVHDTLRSRSVFDYDRRCVAMRFDKDEDE